MSLTPGTRIGPFEIQSELGAGGMGVVYRARDTKLNRDVALKVLPDVFASDPDRLARFQREAQVLASLNHPNIAAIYGLEEADPSTGPVLSDVRPSTGSGRTESKGSGQAVRALVLELVEGPTLAECIAAGSLSPETRERVGVRGRSSGVRARGLPLDEVLPVAKQIAEALEAAHEQGIIHRDLKPANVKIRPDGTVKVLDFGLAKMFDPLSPSGGEGWGEGASQSPTMTTPAATRMGVILGTAAYMSPEQAKGKPVDKRADMWAFGSVLYEMLTGRRPFDGEDVSDVLAAVLAKEPDLGLLPPAVPEKMRGLIRRCLQKDRKQRVPDIGVARLEIDEMLAPQPIAAPAAPTPALAPPPPQRTALLAVALFGGNHDRKRGHLGADAACAAVGRSLRRDAATH